MADITLRRATDVSGCPCLEIIQSGTTAMPVKIGISNSKGVSDFGYQIKYGDWNVGAAANSGSSGVSQWTYPNQSPWIQVPPTGQALYVTPYFLMNPQGSDPGATFYNNITNISGTTATFTRDDNSNAGIMIGVSASGGGGPEA